MNLEPNLPQLPSLRLDGKRALVTGASSGIGRGCAIALAQAGAHVTLAARRSDQLNALEEVLASQGAGAEVMAVDISQIAETTNAIKACEVFDILVNSAGSASHGPALETSEEAFDAVAAVNFKGAYFLTRTVAAQMIEDGRPGSIINISSQMGHIGGVDRSVYCATKHAVEGFTKAMSVEWGPYGIRVNTICPTFIRTALTESTFEQPERLRWIKERIKLGRIGTIEDIMGPVVFLASDASALMTGSALIVDGGWLAG